MVKDEFLKGLEKFNSGNLFVIDFSAIVNVNSRNLLDCLTQYVLTKSIKVAVCREFYENYDVIIKSTNEEQVLIAKLTHRFLDTLEKNDCLFYMGDIIDSKEIIEKLHKNPKVCFVYYKNSEFSENIIRFKDSLCAKAIVVDEEGDMVVCTERNNIIDLSERVADISVIDDDYFATTFEPSKGALVKTKDGKVYTLSNVIGSGGEGAIYNCAEEPDYVIKIYHRGQLNKLRLKKIFMMEKKQIRYEGICWPEKVVFSCQGEPIGYMMKKIDGKPLSAIFDGDESVLREFPNWKKQNLILLVIDILEKVQYLHLFGILIGDLRMKNIVINKNGKSCIVDIDSCQIGMLPCPIGFADFTPPELQRIEFKKQLRTYYNESFSCAVLVFKLLFCGLHPYNQRFTENTLEQNIMMLNFPYPQNIDGDFSKIPWGGYDEMWKHIPFQMQSFFYDIFKCGTRYSNLEMILMMKTYNEFLDYKKNTIPKLNEITFFNE